MCMIVCGGTAVGMGLTWAVLTALGPQTAWLPVVAISGGMATLWGIVTGVRKIDHIFR